jgi:MEMO1 family protein
MKKVRPAAVAGLFYPSDPRVLRAEIERLLREVKPPALRPKALIAPHAGYIYSGSIAAHAYATLKPRAREIRRVVLIGPSHYVSFRGLALPDAEAFVTPLGSVELDTEALRELAAHPSVKVVPAAHEREHSLEVHLPFLQAVLPEFKLVPLAAGDLAAAETAAVLELLWGGPETLIVVSSDLSHYRSYPAAAAIDSETARAIEHLDHRPLDGEHACGWHPIQGLLHVARRRGLSVVTLDRRNSGDTAGDKTRVVGYGAWAFSEAA